MTPENGDDDRPERADDTRLERTDDTRLDRTDDARLERIVEVYDAPGRPRPAASPTRVRCGGALVAVCLGVALLTGFAPVAVGLLLVAMVSAVALAAADGPGRTTVRVRSRAVAARGRTDLRNRLSAVRAALTERPG